MKAVVIFKWAPNPDDALVRVDGTVNWSTARHDVGDDDHAAMACAVAAAWSAGFAWAALRRAASSCSR